MSVPDRPAQVDQLDGSRYAGLNCNCAAAAMAIDRATLGVRQTTGARVRALTGDTSGGTTLGQIVAVARQHYGVTLDAEYGIAFAAFEARIRAGQGAVLQGRSSVTRGTSYQESETFGGNHSWFVNDVDDAGRFLCFLPLGDARRAGISDSPRRIPRSVVREFAGKLDVSDPDEPYRPLGVGKVYAAFTRDTEPHAHFRYGGRRTDPFPDRTRATGLGYLRSAPRTADAYEVRRLREGELFVAYQVTDAGDAFGGSRRWYGNHNGTRWVHASRLRYKGG